MEVSAKNILTFSWILLLIFIFPTYAQGQQLEIKDVTFIPNTISANSGVIVLANVQGTGSIRVTWFTPTYYGQGYNVLGNLFRVDKGKYMCYFSNTDNESMCGPSPFIEPNMGDYVGNPPVDFNLWAQSEKKEEQNDLTSKTEHLYVGSIKLNSIVTVGNENLYMMVYPNNIVSSVKYEVYSEKLNKLAEGELKWDAIKGGYTKGIPYRDEFYYVAFSALSSNDVGGNVVRVPKESKTAIKSNLQIEDVVIHDAVVKKNMQTTFHHLFKITNLGNTLTNLQVKVPPALSSYLEIQLENTTLLGNETTYMDIILKNIAADTDIRTTADLMSGTEKVGEIKVNIEVSVIKGEVSTTLPKVTPSVWVGNYELGVANKEFTISNNAGVDITGINYTASSNLRSIITVNAPTRLSSFSTEKIQVKISPRTSGTVSGVININTNAGSIEIPIVLNFYEKITSQINETEYLLKTLEARLTNEQQAKLYSVLTEIDNDIRSASASEGVGDYLAASKDIERAKTKIDTISKVIASGAGSGDAGGGSGGNTAGNNNTAGTGSEGSGILIIIVVLLVVAVAGIGIWYYFTKLRGPDSEEDEWEDELEDEL